MIFLLTGEPIEKNAPENEVAAVERREPPAATPPRERTHIIRPGDNLFRIGIKYNVSWKILMECNDLPNPDSIQLGQTLKIPPGECTVTEDAPPPSEGEKRSGLQRGRTLHR